MNSVASLSNSTLQVLRLPQVCQATGLCRSMIYQLESDQRFPRRIKLGVRAVGWVETEVQEWLANQIARSRRATLRASGADAR